METSLSRSPRQKDQRGSGLPWPARRRQRPSGRHGPRGVILEGSIGGHAGSPNDCGTVLRGRNSAKITDERNGFDSDSFRLHRITFASLSYLYEKSAFVSRAFVEEARAALQLLDHFTNSRQRFSIGDCEGKCAQALGLGPEVLIQHIPFTTDTSLRRSPGGRRANGRPGPQAATGGGMPASTTASMWDSGSSTGLDDRDKLTEA